MHYCCYLRKSRADEEAEARGEGETLARHRRILCQLAKSRNIIIEKEYPEVVSGESIAARPQMQQLLLDCEKGMWDGILVMEVERLARGDTIDQGIVAQTLKYTGTKIITPVKTYDPNNEYDEEFFEFGLFMSRREYKTINRRLQTGRIQSIKEGRYVASRPPYGYTRKKLTGEKGFSLAPDPGTAFAVKIIYDFYTHGIRKNDGTYERIGVNRIANELNRLKIKPQKNEKWSGTSIRDILINPVYAGLLRWNWRPCRKKIIGGEIIQERRRSKPADCTICEGKHQPVIDRETWELAQRYMAINPPRPLSTTKAFENPLAGLIVCGKCGRKMQRRPYSAREPSMICPYKDCNNVASDLALVEKKLLQALNCWLPDYQLKWEQESDVQTPEHIELKSKTIKKLEAEKIQLQNQLDKAYDLLEQGVYTKQIFISRSENISSRIKDLDSLISTMNREIEDFQTVMKNHKSIVPKIEKLMDLYYKLPTPQAKNNLLKEVLEKVVYIKERSGRWTGTPDEFRLILYPRIS